MNTWLPTLGYYVNNAAMYMGVQIKLLVILYTQLKAVTPKYQLGRR